MVDAALAAISLGRNASEAALATQAGGNLRVRSAVSSVPPRMLSVQIPSGCWALAYAGEHAFIACFVSCSIVT